MSQKNLYSAWFCSTFSFFRINSFWYWSSSRLLRWKYYHPPSYWSQGIREIKCYLINFLLSTNQFSDLVFSWITFPVFVKIFVFIRQLICFCLVSAVSTLFPLIQQTLMLAVNNADFATFNFPWKALSVWSGFVVMYYSQSPSLSLCVSVRSFDKYIGSACVVLFYFFPINVYTAITPPLYHVFIFILVLIKSIKV